MWMNFLFLQENWKYRGWAPKGSKAFITESFTDLNICRSCLPFQVKFFTALWQIKEQTIKIYLSSFSIHYWSQENSVWKEVGSKFWVIADNS